MSTIAPQRRALVVTERLLIGGERVAGEGEPVVVFDPATEQEVAQVASASVAQVEAAVLAARQASDAGPRPALSPAERSAALHGMP